MKINSRHYLHTLPKASLDALARFVASFMSLVCIKSCLLYRVVTAYLHFVVGKRCSLCCLVMCISCILLGHEKTDESVRSLGLQSIVVSCVFACDNIDQSLLCFCL